MLHFSYRYILIHSAGCLDKQFSVTHTIFIWQNTLHMKTDSLIRFRTIFSIRSFLLLYHFWLIRLINPAYIPCGAQCGKMLTLHIIWRDYFAQSLLFACFSGGCLYFRFSDLLVGRFVDNFDILIVAASILTQSLIVLSTYMQINLMFLNFPEPILIASLKMLVF